MVFKNTLKSRKYLRHISEENEEGEEDRSSGNVSTNRSVCTFCLLLVLPFLSLCVLMLGRLVCYNVNEIGPIDYVQLFKRNVILELWGSNFGPFLTDFYFEERAPIESFIVEDVNMPSPPLPSAEKCSIIQDSDKFDCLPRGDVNEKSCEARGCCYATSTTKNVPFCFYPKDYNSYKYEKVNKTERVVEAILSQQFKSPYPKDLPKIKLTATFVSDQVLIIMITDEGNKRYRLPFPELPGLSREYTGALYDFQLDTNSTGFRVLRKGTNTTIFDAQNIGGFIFADQMIQLSAKLPTQDIFGLGESRHPFRVGTDWRTITLHNHDAIPEDNSETDTWCCQADVEGQLCKPTLFIQALPALLAGERPGVQVKRRHDGHPSLPMFQVNGYGSHPVYLGLEAGGLAHTVFLLSSYSMDIVLQPTPGITYRVLGGPLVLGFNLGPSPIEANSQYVSLVGRPHLPPYWALGFHLCRFGYKSLDDMKTIWNQTRAAGIPFDTQWTDLDYMKDQNDFTLSEKFKDLPQFVDHLHEIGMHYVVLIDPGVSGSEKRGSYPPLDVGLQKDIFIKDTKGKAPLYGKVWNYNSTVFPDFAHPQAVPYWVQMIEDFHKIVKIDGAWIDMNEPSNMVDGSLSGCPPSSLDQPPYLPGVNGGKLNYKTVCMSARHHAGLMHYQVHNVYASLEAVLTNFALANAREGRRGLVISRASSPGLGAYSGHWTGDVRSTWEDMAQSISDLLAFSLFGVPLVGADICGFNGNTTVALCGRWTQLGAFYPFSRNHNSDTERAQDPVSLGLEGTARIALSQRYHFLPYLYTLFFQANSAGTPVLWPTFYLAPEDPNTYSLEDQFLWGDGLLIAPALKDGVSFVTPYLPKGVWYFVSGGLASVAAVNSSGQRVSCPAPTDGPVPLLLRGGRVVPAQAVNGTTTASRLNPYILYVALDSNNSSTGSLFVDDGDTLEGSYNLVQFSAANNSLTSEVVTWTYGADLNLGSVALLGNFTTAIAAVSINGQTLKFSQHGKTVLEITEVNWNMKNPFKLQWN